MDADASTHVSFYHEAQQHLTRKGLCRQRVREREGQQPEAETHWHTGVCAD